jgi:tetrahydromethanopterin S-methyltransferase subunit A
MNNKNDIELGQTELETGMALAKCRQCGCMQETLDHLAALLPSLDSLALADKVAAWRELMQPVRYNCLGCEHCYPAVAQNTLARVFPEASPAPALDCNFQVSAGWPPVVGEYFVVDKTAPVAVSTLASLNLAAELARERLPGLAIVGKTETENIGLDKIIKNVISQPAIRYLVVAGRDPAGHYSGRTLLALAKNGVNAKGRVIGSPGKRPFLRNVSVAEIQAFREQVQVIDMLGCEEPAEIGERLAALTEQAPVSSCGCSSCCEENAPPISISTLPTLTATEPDHPVKLDPAGYFVIVPLADKKLINVEHYAYDDTLLHVIEGPTARAIYKTIIANDWVTELSHAAYLGQELAKAELALQYGQPYVQDGA